MTLMSIKESWALSIVRKMPPWLTAMHLTWLRFFLVAPLIWFLIHNWNVASFVIFLLAAVLDYLDGPLARYRHQVSNAGKLLDPLADKLIAMPVVIIIGSQFIPWWLILLIVSLEILLVLMSSLLKLIFHRLGLSRPLGANIFGKIKFTIQVVACLLMLVLPVTPTARWLLTALCLLAATFAFISIIRHIIPTYDQNQINS